jgi:hypothetical protein
MPRTYDVQSFDLDYCQADVAKITMAIKSKASLLVIGMPGCGKSRLVNFLLQRPGVLEQHDLSNNLRFIRVDCDIVTTHPQSMYLELLRALGNEVDVFSEGGLEGLKNRLIKVIKEIEPSIDLVVIFDNFTKSLQQALGEDFFNFLYALRNIRPGLNMLYIFVVNLQIDLAGFYRLNRLFDKGTGGSICWISLLDREDTYFSIDRQVQKVEQKLDSLSETDKEQIYALAGGHALLTRYLTQLVISGEASLETKPAQLLTHSSLSTTCEAIWNDLEEVHKNYLVDLAAGVSKVIDKSQIARILFNYGILKESGSFFSFLFESYVKTKEKARLVVNAQCDASKTRIVIKTLDHETSFVLQKLSLKKRRLLCYLLENQGETCSKDELIAIGWPSDNTKGVSDESLSRQIEGVRSWLKEQLQGQYLTLEAVWGEGYRLTLKG